VNWRKATPLDYVDGSSPYDLRLSGPVLLSTYRHVRKRLEQGYRNKELQQAVGHQFWREVSRAGTVEDFGDISATVARSGMQPPVRQGVQRGLVAMFETFSVLAGLKSNAPLAQKAASAVMDECGIKAGTGLYANPNHFDMLRENTVLALKNDKMWPNALRPVSFHATKYIEGSSNFMLMRQHLAILDGRADALELMGDRFSRSESQQVRVLRQGVQFAFDSLCQSTGFGVDRKADPATAMVAAHAWRLTHPEHRPFNQFLLPAPRS